MNEELKELLGEEIKIEIGNLANMEPGSEEHSKAVDNLAKLYRLKIEEEKNAMEISEQIYLREQNKVIEDERLEEQRIAREQEELYKKDQLAKEIRDQYLKYGLEAGLGLVTLMFYGYWMKKGFKFEETGTITSKTFMGLTKFFRPTRK